MAPVMAFVNGAICCEFCEYASVLPVLLHTHSFVTTAGYTGELHK